LGSLTYSADPESPYSKLIVPAYFSSKAALNMLTLQYAKAFPDLRINSVDPGFTATDLNANRGTQTVTEGTRRNRADGHDWPRGPDGLLHKPRRSRALVEPRRLVGRVRAHLGVPDTF